MRTHLTALAATALLVSGCTATAPPTSLVVRNAAALQPFDSCDQLLDYYQEQALDVVGPYGLGAVGYDEDMAATDDSAGGAEFPAAGDAAVAGTDYSGTNTQEVGVDEADIVKTDGSIIVTAVGDRVQVTDVASEQVVASIDIPGRGEHTSELLLHDSTLVILSTEWGGGAPGPDESSSAFPATRTVVTRVDVSEPAAPVTLGSVRVEGGYRTARMIEDTVRLVMVSDPTGLVFTHPQDSSLTAEDEARDANRRIVQESTIDDWIPHAQTVETAGEAGATRPLVGCADISRPREPSGLSTLSVLTFDVSGADIRPTSTVGLVASGDTVYASTERLVVATSPWDLWRTLETPTPWSSGELTTDLHTFDISDPDSTDYRASGTVDGHLVNQFALDESEGMIRVATTSGGNGDFDQGSESSLVVLQEDGDELAVTGRVDGMGLTEQIRSVRYLSDDLAAIVTFRQTDPLYLVDTSDPSAPAVAGELKIPGYSTYLHPVGDDRLVGVGQDADPETGATEGLQVSLFDIGDLTAPTRVDQLTWPGGYSPAEWDHRAFLYWESTGQVILPAEVWSETGNEGFTGLLTATVDGDTLHEGPRASTSAGTAAGGEELQRSIVIGDDLWALGYQGLYRYDLDSLDGGPAVPLP